MDKLKFTVWFEVNLTFGSGEIRFLNPGRPFGSPPPFEEGKYIIIEVKLSTTDINNNHEQKLIIVVLSKSCGHY